MRTATASSEFVKELQRMPLHFEPPLLHHPKGLRNGGPSEKLVDDAKPACASQSGKSPVGK